jgi:hypothetical protein
MKVFFYCSYDFSAYGFQFVSIDFENRQTNRVISQNGISSELYTYFSRAGVSILAGYTEDKKAFFLVKDIKYFDTSKKKGEQGYTQYYNLAFIADDKHSDKDVFALAASVLSDYNKFISVIASMFIIRPDIHEGYSIDIDILERFIEQAIKEISVECIKSNQLKTIIDCLHSGTDKSNRYLFAVLFDSWKYALNMFKMPDTTPSPSYTLDKEEFEKLIETAPIPEPVPIPEPDKLNETIIKQIVIELQPKFDELKELLNKFLEDKEEKEKRFLQFQGNLKKHILCASIGGVVLGFLLGKIL